MPTIVLVLLALQVVLFATPLALRLVPVNRVLGLPVPPGPGHARLWYEANARYGQDLVKLGVVLAVIALTLDGMGFPPHYVRSAWFAMALGGFVLVTMEGRLRASEIAARTRAIAATEPLLSTTEDHVELAD